MNYLQFKRDILETFNICEPTKEQAKELARIFLAVTQTQEEKPSDNAASK